MTNLDNVNIRWVFDGRVGDSVEEVGVQLAKDDIIEGFVDKLADDETTLKNLIKSMGEQGNALSERLFNVPSDVIDINGAQFFDVELRKLLNTLIIYNR